MSIWLSRVLTNEVITYLAHKKQIIYKAGESGNDRRRTVELKTLSTATKVADGYIRNVELRGQK